MTYEQIFDDMISREPDVGPGLMMREPALTCGGKVFAFYDTRDDAMCFKLGKGFPIENHGVSTYRFLDPFKNKPPMTAWFIVPSEHADKWPALAREALNIMRK